jgi:hypothetical protein
LILVGGIYFLAGRYGEGHTDSKSWISWVRGYTVADTYWRPLTWKTPLLAGTGFAHTILGGHFVFKIGLEKWITSLLHTHSLDDEYFLVRHMTQGMGRLLFLLSLLLAALTFFFLFKFLFRIRTLTRYYYYITLPLILYFTVYSFYFLFWMPEILEFWIGQCIVFWLLIIGFYEPVNARFNILLSSLFVLIVFINYAGSVRPMQDINNDIGYVRIQKVRELSAPNDLVLIQNPWLLKEFIEYYTLANVVQNPVDPKQKDSLEKLVQSKLASGHKVFIFVNREELNNKPEPGFPMELIDRYRSRAAVLQYKPTELWLIK